MVSGNVSSRPGGKVRVAIAGLGNCASALVEGVCHYRQHPDKTEGLLFPILCGYAVGDIEIVAAFDISSGKVGRSVGEAIYQPPNNFVRIRDLRVDVPSAVFRGPTLDGNPEHLAKLVSESASPPVNVTSVLKEHKADLLVHLLPTGSIEATEFYAKAALEAGCGFVNCIPTPLAQREDFQKRFAERRLPLLGDDVKSQMGTTILHRALLGLLEMRGARLTRSSQINVGGNTDFANFLHRSETKLVSKHKSLRRYVKGADSHIGHHFDPTRGSLKTAFIDIDAAVFGISPVKISVRLESDDKPNCAGSIVDLVRLAKGALDRGMGGCLAEACAFYFKSPPADMPDLDAYRVISQKGAAGPP
jgi:myo-inositol-1-phosphate synthase